MSSFRLRLLNVDGASRNSLGVRRVKAERCGGVIGMQISAMLLCDEKADELENRREGRPLPKGIIIIMLLLRFGLSHPVHLGTYFGHLLALLLCFLC